MNKRYFLLCVFSLLCISLSAAVSLLSTTRLVCEYEENPTGIDTPDPRFGWQIIASLRNQVQSAYQIIVSDQLSQVEAGKGTFWDTQKINSAQSLQIVYKGKTLKSASTYYWKVRVWNAGGTASPWSETATFQTGLLQPSDWDGAQWITFEETKRRVVPGIHQRGNDSLGTMRNTIPLFRKEFEITKPVARATAFVCGLGQFEMHLNGKKVGDHFLDPAWTQYDAYSFYVPFDITTLLVQGRNAAGFLVGNGFYHTPRERYVKLVTSYGNPTLICKILIEYQDGSKDVLVSNTGWKTAASPITFSSIYGGEDYDASMEQEGWDSPGFDDKTWKQSLPAKGAPKLIAQHSTPMKVMSEIPTERTFKNRNGVWIYDLGQNASGIIRLKVSGARGKQIKVWPGELLARDSTVTQRATGGPYYFAYTPKSNASETWEPRFTYYGFRYLQIEGAVPKGTSNPLGLPEIESLSGLHTSNAAPVTGSFSCSNPLFNQIFNLIDWSVKSNLAHVVTDCPHREKLGWLEQMHLMGASIRYTYGVNRLFTKVVQDMQTAQTKEGLIPDIAPEYVPFEGGFRDSPEWGSAYVIIPWYMYQWYGDTQLLTTHYNDMKSYVEYLKSKSQNNMVSHGLGDWFDLGPGKPGESQLTSKGVTATAIYYYDVTIMEQIAKLLGKNEDAGKFALQAAAIRTSFNSTYYHAGGYYDRNSQTANAMALYMGLVEPQNKQKVLDHLIADIRGRNNGITAGDIGFRYVLRVLEDNNCSDVVFDMNSRYDVPGYGFQLAKGATALTESWPALENVSNNHLMLGHLLEWFYSGAAGIRQKTSSQAFKEIIIHPEMVGDLTQVRAHHDTPYGTIRSEWNKTDNQIDLLIEIPVNTTAEVALPTKAGSVITESGINITKNPEVKILRSDNNRTWIAVGSGVWRFRVHAPAARS